MLVCGEGIEPTTSAFGGPRSDPAELTAHEGDGGRVEPYPARPPCSVGARTPQKIRALGEHSYCGFHFVSSSCPPSTKRNPGISKTRASTRSRTFVLETRLPLVHPEGFEPPTSWFVAKRSVQLSYGCKLTFRAFRTVLGTRIPNPETANPRGSFEARGFAWFQLCLCRLLLGRPSGPGIGLTDALVPLRGARAHDRMSNHRSGGGGGGDGDGERHGGTSW